MQPADIDPTLCTGEPLERLDDGFSPPARQTPQGRSEPSLQPEPALSEKSQF